MLQRRDRLVAEDALFSFVPVGDDVPHQALFGVGFDLSEAILATVLPLGPARTLIQTKSWFV